MKSRVELFYDQFSRTFVRDYVLGNRRVERQLKFFHDALPVTAQRVLVLGCGSGESALAVARWRSAQVLAIDLSEENLRLARALHADPRVTYQKLDITKASVTGSFDAILLPDVYEHIPVADRGSLHAMLRSVLGDVGRILMTIPSVGKQAALAQSGGLQIIDESVSIEDLLELASDVGGDLVYFNLISVWETNDYAHAVIARGTRPLGPLQRADSIPAAELPRNALSRIVDLVRRGPRAFVRLSRLPRAIRTSQDSPDG